MCKDLPCLQNSSCQALGNPQQAVRSSQASARRLPPCDCGNMLQIALTCCSRATKVCTAKALVMCTREMQACRTRQASGSGMQMERQASKLSWKVAPAMAAFNTSTHWLAAELGRQLSKALLHSSSVQLSLSANRLNACAVASGSSGASHGGEPKMGTLC